MIKISVIIPSYNQASYLEETIQSVLNQNYPNLEIILIDGKSEDRSIDIIKKYEKHFTYWVSEKDSGQSEAINKGFQKATGDIVTWLCSDDLYTEGALMKVNEIFSQLPPNVGLIHGSSLIFMGKKIIRLNKGTSDDSLENILSGMTFPQPSAFFRKSLLDKTGLLDTNLHYGMDYDLFSKFAIISKFQFVDHCFSKYRLHPESKTISSVSKFIDDWSKVYVSILQASQFKSMIDTIASLDIKIESNKSTLEFFKDNFQSDKVEQERFLYRFLCFVLRYDYESKRFDRAEKIAKYIKRNLRKHLEHEPEIKKIVWRTAFPPTLLIIARKISRALFYR
jgi:glycosyltransferase involved in cell wall biosynthesis